MDEAGADAVLALANSNPDVWATVGLHPDAAGADLGFVTDRAHHQQVVALGEMGLDYFHTEPHDDATRAAQRDAFDAQLALAAANELPVVVHTRQAEADTLAALRNQPRVTGVLHCFTESWSMAEAALDLGYFISISGIVTFRNGDNVRDVARRVPADRLLVETDCPWLAPVPHRGKRNEPAFVADTAQYVAALRQVHPSDLAEQTTDNFRRLFPRTLAARP